MLTDRQVAAARPKKVEYWLTDRTPGRGTGRLVMRVLPSGAKRWYYRYAIGSGSRKHLLLGDYTADGRGMSLTAARDKVAELRLLHKTPGSRDVGEYLAQQAAQAARAAELEKVSGTNDSHTLRELVNEYVAHLESAKKASAPATRRVLERYVLGTEYAERAASSLAAADFVDLLRRITTAGKGRTAAMVRSHLHAAFALATRAELNPAASGTIKSFGLSANPITPISAMAQFSRVRERTLSSSELRAYMRRIDALPSVTRSALWLALLLGGQRPAQLLRLRVSDVDFEARTARLLDPKGKRVQPRPHLLPLDDATCSLLAPLIAARNADESPRRTDFVFTTDGEVAMRIETVSSAVTSISKAMVEANEAKDRFQMRDVRRTCETMLAAIGIPKHIRARVLSHGISGVQDQRYDRHEYMPEKREALQAWGSRLQEIWQQDPAGARTEPRPAALSKRGSPGAGIRTGAHRSRNVPKENAA